MRTYTAIDLFSGCGGLTEGLKQAGFSVIAGAEIRPEARSAYSLNHPGVYLVEDIRKMQYADVAKIHPLQPGDLDLLAACPPCQGFSTLRTFNREKPADDKRNKLIFQVSRLVSQFLPKAVLVENVPGLLSNWRIDDFRRRIERLGYRTAQTVLDAARFGVPQRRKRMILIGVRSSTAPTLPTPDAKPCITVRDVLGSLPSCHQPSAPPLHKFRQKLSESVMERVRDIPKDGGSRADLGVHRQLPCHIQQKGQRPRGFKDIYGRLSWDKVAPTITRYCHNPSKGRFLHPEEDRGLTLYEALLLQGFPLNYLLPIDIGMGKIASLIGEAFPPPFARAQAEHIRKLLRALPLDEVHSK